jgi:hypothetical protein
VAGLASIAISGASKAAPIAPLPYAVTSTGGNVVQASITTTIGTIIATGIITTGISGE